ncbi:MAG TPA: hypothetical protein VNN18_11175 [Candidatus Xenobia bacterium]|nr:hypothetical protein [Candidatus Xenobia bacterium]
MSATEAATERRRGQRVFLVLPVELHWTATDGQAAMLKAETGMVSAFGATLQVKSAPPPVEELELRLPSRGLSAKARLVGARPAADGLTSVAVELISPDEGFWGVSLPPPPVYGLRIRASADAAAAVATLLEKLKGRKVPAEVTLEIGCGRPLPGDLWKEIQDLLREAGLKYEENP